MLCCSRFLDRVNNYYWFVGLSFFLRIIESIGTTGIYVTIFWIIGTEFPDNVGPVFVRENVVLKHTYDPQFAYLMNSWYIPLIIHFQTAIETFFATGMSRAS